MIQQNILTQEYNKLKPSLFNDLATVINYPSILTVDSSSTPFGLPIDHCLNATLTVCRELGFQTYKDPEGYYGYAEIGEGSELIGILCHIDVVPVEDPDQWATDPFTLIQSENKLIARGIADDKGPTIVCLYALKTLLNLNISLKKRFRFIFGTDEENLWRCINKYKQNEEIPTKGFTPDGNFPVIHAEKGLLQFILHGKGEDITITGGGVFNAVPFSIEYTGPEQQKLSAILSKYNYTFQQDNSQITIIGKSAHAQSTEEGINPISRLMIGLQKIGISSPSINFIADKIRDNPYGELLFGSVEDEVSGKLKTNLSKVDINHQYSKLYFDFRIPVTRDIDDLIKTLKTILPSYQLEYEEYDRVNSLYIPKDDPFVRQLCQIYYEETGLNPTPLSTGGATYSRALKNFVTFGMGFPDSVSTAHQRNEYITVEDLEKAFTIYTKTFISLNNS